MNSREVGRLLREVDLDGLELGLALRRLEGKEVKDEKLLEKVRRHLQEKKLQKES